MESPINNVDFMLKARSTGTGNRPGGNTVFSRLLAIPSLWHYRLPDFCVIACH